MYIEGCFCFHPFYVGKLKKMCQSRNTQSANEEGVSNLSIIMNVRRKSHRYRIFYE